MMLSALSAVSLGACATAPGPVHIASAPGAYARPPAAAVDRFEEVGTASWYGEQYQGRATASGERFDLHRVSGAHPSLPMPSLVEVTNLENGRSLRVRVNDRLPRRSGRVIDLSRGAAEQLGFVRQGLAHVRLRYLGPAGAPTSTLGALTVRERSATLDLDAIARGDIAEP